MPDRTPKPSTKPLKPYRRGETLGKQGLKLRKPSNHKGKAVVQPTSVGLKPKSAAERVEAASEGEGEGGAEKVEEDEAEDEAEKEAEEEEKEEEQGPPPKRVSGKKGKKFLDNVSSGGAYDQGGREGGRLECETRVRRDGEFRKGS